jgi:hypothetical protein
MGVVVARIGKPVTWTSIFSSAASVLREAII